MKAMVLREYKKPLVLEEVKTPEYGRREVLLKVKAAGVCGTDLKIQQGMVPTRELPLIPGHEIAGVIAEIGQDIKEFRVGDEVLVSFYIPCGECSSCRNGRQTICEDLKGRLGFEFNGGFAEYVAVPEKCLIPKPKEISFQQAAVVSDAIATGYHALKRAGIKSGDTIVMVGGGGGLGLHALQVARSMGASIIGIDVSHEKLRAMETWGAIQVLDGSKGEWSQEILRLTQGRGADCVVEFICTRESIQEGINSLKKGGQLLFVAYSPETTFNALKCHLNEIDILSTRAATREDIEASLKLVSAGEVEPIIGGVIKLNELNDGLELIKKGELTGRLTVDVE